MPHRLVDSSKSLFKVRALGARFKSLYPKSGPDAATDARTAVSDLVGKHGPEVLDFLRAEVDRLKPQQPVEPKDEANAQRPAQPDRPVPAAAPQGR